MLPLGFHFYPSDVELLTYYLRRKLLGKKFPFDTIAELDIYKHAPWDLPEKSLLNTGDLKKWFFFCPIKKYARGAQLNRATIYGYWKSTGKDRPVMYNKEVVGMIKTLVFHRGKALHGKTDWVMHEYRLEDKELAERGVVQDTYVLCLVFKKDDMGLGNNAQYGAPFKEEDWSNNEDDNLVETGPISILSRLAFGGANDSHVSESLCAASSIQSNGFSTLDLLPTSIVSISHNTVIGNNALPLEGGSDTNAAFACMDAPNVMFVDEEVVHALMEAVHLAQFPQVQESNDSISSLLGIFTEDDAAFITCNNGGNGNDFTFEVPQVSEDDGISLMEICTEDDAEFITYIDGQMTGNGNDFTLEVPPVSEDDDISLMLASFIEDDAAFIEVPQVSEDDDISLMLASFVGDNAAFIEVPQDSGDDDIQLMLASFIEEEDWNNVWYPL
ncbi:No apical meristem (NAM) protein [Corchorus olitorius]|uniref:No apical meristem (NAM) protein n=1 Tax=Corchorus olitorius TaxID=93759 RepID=A0A1R3JM40_9ROSI|nr:No apical meristem (NAM) protein [Corchorus olitorius]